MRYLLSLLLLTTATPAFAAQPVLEEQEQLIERPSPDERPQRIERAERFERLERAEPAAERPRMFERVIRAERRERDVPPPVAMPEPAPRQEQSEHWSSPAPENVVERPEPDRPALEGGTERSNDSVREWRWRERNAERRRRSSELPPAGSIGERLVRPDAVVPPVAATPPAPATRSEGRIGNTLRNRIATEGWRREWRGDRRFDWRRHRYGYRDRFDVGIYVDPFGWNYRRWNVGWRLPRHHYARHFWLHDPWHYRLPPVYGPYRWVRYWDDALLIDLRTGRVVDVIHDFFW